jgi:hypothetical protein
MRVRFFIDFWSFQLNWNARMVPRRRDWRALPKAMAAEAALLLHPMGVGGPLVLEETLLYASVDPTIETTLKNWLNNTVEPRSTIARTAILPMPHEQKRGVDAAIVTDLLSLAFQRSYDLAILVSTDADFVPGVEYLQSVGLKVINAGWSNRGHHLKRACWASFDLEKVALNATRN